MGMGTGTVFKYAPVPPLTSHFHLHLPSRLTLPSAVPNRLAQSKRCDLPFNNGSAVLRASFTVMFGLILPKHEADRRVCCDIKYGKSIAD
jgi:hypothetical protein